MQEKNQLLKRAQLTRILNLMYFYVILFIRKSKQDKTENFADYIDGFMTGAVKYKPYVLLSATSLNSELTLSMCVRGNEKDKTVA